MPVADFTHVLRAEFQNQNVRDHKLGLHNQIIIMDQDGNEKINKYYTRASHYPRWFMCACLVTRSFVESPGVTFRALVGGWFPRRWGGAKALRRALEPSGA